MRNGVQDTEHTGPPDLAFYSEGHRESLEASEQSLQRAAPWREQTVKQGEVKDKEKVTVCTGE